MRRYGNHNNTLKGFVESDATPTSYTFGSSQVGLVLSHSPSRHETADVHGSTRRSIDRPSDLAPAHLLDWPGLVATLNYHLIRFMNIKATSPDTVA